MPQIPESDAFALAQNIDTLEGVDRVQALDVLTRYQQQQDDLGEPEWPSQVKALQDRQTTINGLYSGGLDKVQFDVSPWSKDPAADKATYANMAFLADRYGKTPQEIADRHDFYRNDYARQFFGQSNGVDDKAFYGLAAKEIQRRQQVNDTFMEGAKSALRGEDVIPALQSWQQKNGLELMSDSTEFTKGFLSARSRSGDQLEFADTLLKQIESNVGMTRGDGSQRPAPAGQEMAAQFEASLAKLAEMKPRERKQVYAIIGAKAEAAGYDQKGFWAQMLSYAGKQIARFGDTTSTAIADVAAGGAVAESAMGGFGGDAQDRFAANADKRGKRGVIYDELADIASGVVDPVKPTVGWIPDNIETGLIKAPGAVAPFMLASAALGPLGGGMLFTADFAEQNRRELVRSGMDDGKARLIGGAAAPFQAAVESLSNGLQLGSFPAVQKALAAFTKPIGGGAGMLTRYGLNASLSLATEYTEEQLQDNVIRPAVQNIAAAFDKDVPSIGIGQIYENIKKSTPELLFTLAPMALVFGGTMTAAQANLSALMLSSQDLLEAAGYSAAQANSIRAEASPEAQISKARELWGARDGTAQSMEDAAKSVGERMKLLQTDVAAAQKDLEQRGILPRMLHATDDRWRLTFNDGSTADFNSHAEADSARWQWATDQLGKVHLATREALAQMERNAAVGREFAVEFKPDAMTARQAVDEGRADEAQIQRRLDQGEAAGESEAYDNAIATAKAMGDDHLASLQILGSSSNAFKDGVLTTTIKLFEGAHVLTLVEEKLEGAAKQILANQKGRDWMLQGLRNYEQASGDTILRKVTDDQLTNDDLIEAWSSLGQSYLVGQSKKGAAIGKGGARRIFADVLKAGMGGAMNAETQFFNAVWRRAAKLSKLKREGKLSGDVTAELERQLGIDSQAKHESEAAKEADAIANEALYAGGQSYSEDNPGPNGETFSLVHPFEVPAFVDRKYQTRLAEWEKTGDAGRDPIILGFTPPVLQVAGADNLSIVVPPSLFDKVTKDAHAVPVEALRQLPQSLADPVAVFQSRGHADALLVLTEHREAGKGPVVIAIHLNRKEGRSFKVNQVASMYGRPEANIAAMFNEQPLYVNKKKRLAWERQAGKQYPGSGTPSQGKGSIPGPDDVVKWAENKLRERGSTSFSLRKFDFSSRMAAAFSPFQRSPELRIVIAQVAKARAQKLGAEWIEKAAVLRSSASIGKDARMREALAYETRMNEYLDGLTEVARQTLEFEPADIKSDPLIFAMLDHGKLMSFTTAKRLGKVEAKSGDYDGAPRLPSSWYSKGAGIMPDQMAQAMHDAGLLLDAHTDTLWNELGKRLASSAKDKAAYTAAQTAYKEAEKYARDASRAEADAWAAKAKEKATSPKAQRDMLKAALRTLDGILSAAPPEVRARVGGYVKLAGLATDEAMLKEIERRIEKLNVELEKWLKKEGVEQVQKLLKKGRATMESGKKGKGKDADMHHLFAAAEKASKMDAAAVAGELARLDSLIAGDSLTPEQETLATTERGLVELLGDLKHADSGRVFSAIDTLRSIYDGAWLKWKLAEIERKERRAGMRQDFIDDTGKQGLKPERDAADKAAATLLGKIKGGFLSLSSFHEVLSYAFGSKSERVKSLVDAEREASGQYEDASQKLADEVGDLFTSLAGDVLAGERLRFDMAQRTIKTAKGELSQLEAIQALLMWLQEDGRRHMEGHLDESGKPAGKWHYDQAWIDEITAALTPEAKQVMSFIMKKYGAEWATLNPLYRARYGVNMPAHDNYAPITVTPSQSKAGEVVDPVTGAAMSSGSILTPGSLRTRARNVVAEPEFRDALQTLILHSRQLEYWKAYYDLASEMSAIMGNREVLNAVHAKGGKEAANALRQWVDAIAQGGFNDASMRLELMRGLSRVQGRAAGVALLGRMSAILSQSTQLAAAAVQMPLTSYLWRLAKLTTGNLGWTDSIKSDFIQRRYKSAPPLVRQAMDSLAAAKPNQIQRMTRFFGNVLSGADAYFTSGTYAILLDYHYTQGEKMGLAGAALDTYAHTEAERATEQVAQPTRLATRSLAELTTTNPLAKIGWAFASEARQKVALFGWAAANFSTDPARTAKAAALTFIIGGLFTQVLKNLLREAKGDDDDGMWSPGRLLYAATAAPLVSAIPFGSAIAGDSNTLSSVKRALNSLSDGEVEWSDVDAILSAAGIISPWGADTFAALAQLSHLGQDSGKIIHHLTE